MLSGLQGWHIVVIVIALVLLFGAKRLPDAAKGVGKSLRIFKSEAKAMREQDEGNDTGTSTAPATDQLPSAGGTSANGAATDGAASTAQTPQQAQPTAETQK